RVVEETTFRSGCRGNCGSRCPMEVTVREGYVTKIRAMDYPEADANRRRICVKGYSQPQRVYDPDRIKYPMRRTGERGEGQWERVSWDDATQEVAEKIGAAVQNYGGSSVAFWSSYGSYGVLNGAMSGYLSVAYGRFITAIGATVLGAGADTAQQYLQSTLLGISGNDFVDAANAKTIISWGGNPAEAYVHAWQFVCDARENGAKLITIDPQFTASAMHSDIYLPIRPGTDGALMLAMANYIVENDLVDLDYVQNNTISPFLVKEDGTYLRMSDLGVEPTEGPISSTTGLPTTIDPVVVWDESTGTGVQLDDAVSPAVEGTYEVEGFNVTTVYTTVMDSIKEYTVEKAAEICDLSEDQITELAEIYATEGPVYVMTFQGIGHHVNSHHNYKNLALIAALTGNAGKEGASICGAPACGMLPFNVMAYMLGTTGPSFTGMYLPEVMETGQWAGEDLPIQVLWINNGNVLSCESGRQDLIDAVKKVDYVIVSDVSMNDSAQWADMVLPIPHSFETADIDVVCSVPYPQVYQKGIEPLYECKTDLEIMRMVAEKMGMDFIFGDTTDEEFLSMAVDSDYNVQAACTADVLMGGDMIRNYTYTDESMVPVYDSSEDGRLKYYVEYPVPRIDFGQDVADYERLPYFEYPNEAYWDNPLRAQYPLMGCSQHYKYSVHSQLAYTPVIRELEPEPMLKINATDAADRGIEQGDYVRVYNDHGYAVLKALVTEGIKPGVVSIPHGFQADQFVEGHTQDLTNVYMNDFCSNSAFYDFLCEVEKYEGGDE
ncbi:MAG: molybdopterin-dependent oxidoreductase, partial [Eggerthellaceae bacterium]|nr:molybdopterin-dependent oxidoreductase [Eggerthellaceae bacterium]